VALDLEVVSVSEGQPSADVSIAALRELYTRLGLSPSEEEIAAAVLGLQRLYDNDRVLQARLGPDVEPVPAPHVRSS
jgi:hypothetical protein